MKNKPIYSELSDLSFKEFLAQKVREMGEKTAIKSRGKSYAWNDIDKVSSAIAFDLEKSGAGVGSHIAILGNNSFNWICAFYAVQKLGGVAVFIGSKLADKEIAFALKLTDVTHVCLGDFARREQFISNSNGIIICDIAKDYTSEKTFDLDIDYKVDPNEVALIFLSSGSEGIPKAVMLSAFAMLRTNDNLRKLFKLSENDKTCLMLPLYHMFGFEEYLHSAMAGACVCLTESTRTKDILKVVSEEKCTIMHAVPTLMQSILSSSEFEKFDVSSLRLSVIAGAPMFPSQLDFLKSKLPYVHFIVIYALSEIGSATNTMYADTDEHIAFTVGKPSKDVKLKIVDLQTGNPCANGSIGEIYIKSPLLFKGYYGVESQPFDDDGWFKTGDLGFVDNDGCIRYKGRINYLINCGGEKIVPLEVEREIYLFQGIENVLVMGIDDEFWGQRVVAFIVMKKDAKVPKESDFRKFLSGKIAEYKIPSEFVILDCFPTLGSGKVDMVKLKNLLIN